MKILLLKQQLHINGKRSKSPNSVNLSQKTPPSPSQSLQVKRQTRSSGHSATNEQLSPTIEADFHRLHEILHGSSSIDPFYSIASSSRSSQFSSSEMSSQNSSSSSSTIRTKKSSTTQSTATSSSSSSIISTLFACASETALDYQCADKFNCNGKAPKEVKKIHLWGMPPDYDSDDDESVELRKLKKLNDIEHVGIKPSNVPRSITANKSSSKSYQTALKKEHNKKWKKKMQNEVKKILSKKTKTSSLPTGNIVTTKDPKSKKSKNPRWKIAKDPRSNRIYSYHTTTHEVSWSKPNNFNKWNAIFDESKKKHYFLNVLTKEKTWIKPKDFVLW